MRLGVGCADFVLNNLGKGCLARLRMPLAELTFHDVAAVVRRAMQRVSAMIAVSLGLVAELAPGAEANRGEQAYRGEIQPLLEKYCYDCHADGTDKGDFALDLHKDYPALRGDLMHWDNVRQQIATHVMPPEKKEQPTLAERDALVAWIDDSVFWMDPEKPDPGHVVYRRLNRTEFDNTVRDTFLIDLKPAKEFPPDDSGYGFDNIGDVLSLSPVLMEKYMRAAGQISKAAFAVQDAENGNILITPDKFWNQKGTSTAAEGYRWFHANGEAATKVRVSRDGNYTVKLRVAYTQAGNDPAKLHLRIGDTDLGEHDVTTVLKKEQPSWQVISHNVRLKAGETKLVVSFLNDLYDEKHPDPEKRDRNLAVADVGIEGPAGLSSPSGSRFLSWLLEGKPAGPPSLAWSGEDFSRGEGDVHVDTGAIEMASSGYVHHLLDIDREGEFAFKIKVGALQAGEEPAKFDLRVAGKTISTFSVTAKDQAPQWFECTARLPAGQHDLQVWFLNDFWDAKTQADRNLWLHEVNIRQTDVPGAVAGADLPRLISRLGERTFRRPLTAEESARWTALAQENNKLGGSTLESLELALEGMLMSPSFLFRGGAKTASPPQYGSALIDEFSLASRLSYFLWASCPDEQLYRLAAKGELRKNFATEVSRMIKDWKAYSLSENFAGQWLQLRDMEIVEPSQRRFPEFKGGMGYYMRRETQTFFEYVLKEDRPIRDFLDGDYTFVNGPLAKFYGVPSPVGDDRNKFEKVSLSGTPRGGILTHGSILTLTSNPTRTSPVKRGKFVLENILGTPPPPAPGGVPPLDDRRVDMEKLTLRQQFEAHRSNASCAGCHAFLDPMGFALENFDAIGKWRDTEKGNPVDVAGSLVRGQKFQNLEEFRKLLVTDLSGDFERNLAEHLLTYALGRGLQHHDKPAVQEIVKKTREKELRFQSMILAVCESAPFQRIRVP